MTVDSFSGNTTTTGAFYPYARFRFGESSDNDRQRLHHFYAAYLIRNVFEHNFELACFLDRVWDPLELI